MNINTIAKYTTVSDICITSRATNGSLVSKKATKVINAGIKVIDVAKWLLRPESEYEQPLFDSRLMNVFANISKSLFWIGVAVGMGFLIAQLSS